MDNKIKGLLFGSFIGDALSLGAHWIYNPSKISRLYTRVTDYISPHDNQYHSGKETGDLSHYGDQTLALLNSVTENGKFELTDFASKWRTLFSAYTDYIDGATTETLANFESGSTPENAGSQSNDLSGAGRIAPLFTAYDGSQADALYRAAQKQTAMTHNEPGVIDAAHYFAATVFDVLAGRKIDDALTRAAAQHYHHLPAAEWLEHARRQLPNNAVEAVKELGQTCHTPDAFPATLYLLLKYGDNLENCLIENIMAGGDSAARGLLLGMILGAHYGYDAIPRRWISGLNAASEIEQSLQQFANGSPEHITERATKKVTFQNAEGLSLDARLELPAGSIKAFALFAHCFTCSKNIPAASRISRALSELGIAVMRFDFTGLGNSDGDFANTNFSSNIQDLIAAAEFLENNYRSPALLIGHSLGGTAVLAASVEIPGVKGVITIGAPSDPAHVTRLFDHAIPEIEETGTAEVNLAGRMFTIKKRFLYDLREHRLIDKLKKNRVAALIMHSPTDQTVSIEHAGQIFEALKHPKSFVSLHPADHLLSRKEDAVYVAKIIAAWSSRMTETGPEN